MPLVLVAVKIACVTMLFILRAMVSETGTGYSRCRQIPTRRSKYRQTCFAGKDRTLAQATHL